MTSRRCFTVCHGILLTSRDSIRSAFRYWAPVLVPGLVQVEAYASALYTAMGHDSDKITELVEGRMGCQKILTRADPPDVTIVLWEPVLNHMIGSPEVMRAQLTRLLGLLRRIVLHVLPGRVGANAGLGGPTNLAAADGAPELLLSDGLVEDWLTNDPGQVRRASATFNNVRGDALPRAESRTVISEAMERCLRCRCFSGQAVPVRGGPGGLRGRRTGAGPAAW
jgi:hypothetical protein